MKKLFFILSACLFVLLVACTNSAEDKPAASSGSSKTTADSLEKEVMDGHDVGMAKMGRISKMRKEAQRLIDSIDHLPAHAQQAAASVKNGLQSLAADLDNASAAMNTWMEEFQYDSARDDLAQRIKYLTDEKLRVDKVKEKILGSIQKADSILQAKF